MRKTINFNKDWDFLKPGQQQQHLSLPHTWNALSDKNGEADNWRGKAEYSKQFERPEITADERVFLEFNGVAMTAEVTLNGNWLCRHEGGFSRFRTDITEYLQDENLLIVAVDNAANEKVYPQMADFTFYGGITRDVNLIVVPEQHFELLRDGTTGIKVTPLVDAEAKRAVIKVETWHNAPSVTITVSGESKTVERCAEFVIENVHLWNGMDDPFLYTATAALPSGDEVSVRFGCRSFSVNPEKGFFLNGCSYPLRGVSRHHDRLGTGSALTAKEQAEDMAIVREIGANTLRLAHYQHAQEFYDLCDENGIIVWAEIPYITKHMSGGRQNAVDQMRELITQCCHHPCIICWGLSNEISAGGTVSEEVLQDHRELNKLCHDMDQTRLTVMAHAFMLEKTSPLIPVADLAGYNLYFGWYLGELVQNEQFLDEYHALYPQRMIAFSEYGADANITFHSSHPEQGDYSEEYQCIYHEHMLEVVRQRPYLWASYVWNLFDFAAGGRDEGGRKGINQKGLVEFDHRTKKDAFYLYKAAWSREPFVHLCGKRYADRIDESTEIKVYSNCDSITLFVDGRETETRKGKTVFTFRIPLTGNHCVEAISGKCSDRMQLRRVEKPNPAYVFKDGGNVVNWFDREEIKSGYYSVRDTFGELLQNPATAAIVRQIMAKASASRGEVAESTKDNKALQQMMAGLSLESLLKKAGANVVPPEMIKTINDALQQIKKEN